MFSSRMRGTSRDYLMGYGQWVYYFVCDLRLKRQDPGWGNRGKSSRWRWENEWEGQWEGEREWERRRKRRKERRGRGTQRMRCSKERNNDKNMNRTNFESMNEENVNERNYSENERMHMRPKIRSKEDEEKKKRKQTKGWSTEIARRSRREWKDEFRVYACMSSRNTHTSSSSLDRCKFATNTVICIHSPPSPSPPSSSELQQLSAITWRSTVKTHIL